MALISEARARVLVVFSVLVAVAAVVAASVVWSRAGDEEDAAPKLREAVVVDDLCAVVEPLVPGELELGDGQSTNDSGDGAERAACVVGSSGATVLEVRVTSHDMPEGDPYGVLDQLVGAACDAVEQQYAAGFTEDEVGCSGQDSGSTTRPVLATAIQVAPVPNLNAIVSVVLTDRRLPAQVAAYASAITYGVVASDLTR